MATLLDDPSRRPDSARTYSQRLRVRAEDLMRRLPAAETVREVAQIEDLFHELNVHQLELEMQNDELTRANVLIDQARTRYRELYQGAPVAYLTISRAGTIEEANESASSCWGVPARSFRARAFSVFSRRRAPTS